LKSGKVFDIRNPISRSGFQKPTENRLSEGQKMKKIEWDTNLSVGIDTIDEQHKMLIQRLNDVSEAIESNQGEGTIAKTLDFLVDYTNFHFSEEEKQMAKHHYPGLEHQKEQHKEFKESLERLEQDFEEDNATKELADHIRIFLFNWLIRHIKEVDMEFGNFLKKK
jgi:hemerythrin